MTEKNCGKCRFWSRLDLGVGGSCALGGNAHENFCCYKWQGAITLKQARAIAADVAAEVEERRRRFAEEDHDQAGD